MFAMAKEFGWTPDQVLDMPYKFFIMYAKELGNYYEEMEAASKGHKRHTKLTDEDKKEKRKLLEKFANGSEVHKDRSKS
jgi:hypothetical protein